MRNSVSAIVPAYNEERTIADVVRVLKRANVFDELIVVDDGSLDKTAARAKEAGATVYSFEQNHGKSAAMRFGVRKTKASIILFSDADLIGLRTEHVRKILEPVVSGKAGMCVGLRDRGFVLSWFIRYMPLIGGERALRREVIEGLSPEEFRGYRGELLMNARCRSLRLPIATVRLVGLRILHKTDKMPFWKGVWGYMRMTAELAHAYWLILRART